MSEKLHPNRVPGAETASAHPEKLVSYLLNPEHEQGRSKARLFVRLGFDRSNWEDLQQCLLSLLPTVEGTAKKENGGGGMNYEAQMTVTGPAGSAEIRTVWCVSDEGTSLITAYKARKRAG